MVQEQYLTEQNTAKVIFFRNPQNSQKAYCGKGFSAAEEISWQQIQARVLEKEFEEAAQNREFLVYYQPKINALTDKISGAEALVRWRRRDGSIVPPSEFIPAYEKTGLIKRLDEYVFCRVCEYQRTQLSLGRELIPISVNLSRVSISDDETAERYSHIVQDYDIPFSCVPIELTESAAVCSEEISATAEQMVQQGFVLHMDDFGSGFSSLMSLNNISFQTLKLDKQLIDRLDQEKGRIVVEQIITLAHLLKMNVVAEGVESREQVEILKEMNCFEIQGYYYSRPMPQGDFEKYSIRNGISA